MKAEECVSQSSELDRMIHMYDKRNTITSMIRLIVFVAAVLLCVVGIYNNHFLEFLGGAFLGVLFISLVVYHARVLETYNYLTARKDVVDRYKSRFSEEWRTFVDTGEEFLKENSMVERDLDIFGKNSLYQFLNCGNTPGGRKKLAQALSGEYRADIDKRAAAIDELLDNDNFVINFETLSRQMQKTGNDTGSDYDKFIEYCNDEKYKLPTMFNIIKWIGSVAFIAIMVGTVLLKWSIVYIVGAFLVLLGLSWITSSVTGRILNPLHSFSKNLQQYIYMFDVISTSAFKSEMLERIREDIRGDMSAAKGLKKINAIIDCYNIRYNHVVHALLSGSLLWDFWLATAIEKWKKTYGKRIEIWIDTVSTMEELISLSVVGRVRDYSFPHVVDEEKVTLKAVNAYHPLIKNGENLAVKNSIDVTENTIIITGSNMSGKTTFLRTLGINLILAYAGAPVCADSLDASYMKIFTSMRVVDDVSNGISTFYAEILRIKNMVEYSKENKNMLCLIDEIFKGTNSADRIIGAKAVIKNLEVPNCISFVSTHDFELCDMADENAKVTNYHFQEYYEKDELKFDYKLRDGRCTTTNAVNILKMAGIYCD